LLARMYDRSDEDMIWFDRVEDIMHLKAKPLQILENVRCVKSDIWKIGDQSYGSLSPVK
jgi:hypothetical protein